MSDGPFIKGGRYEVLQDFNAMRDVFREGEILTYTHSVWSRYDGITGYLFTSEDVPGTHVWDVYDDEPLEIWRRYFRKISD